MDSTPPNPWLDMWTSPRATIQHIIEINPTYMVLVLASLSGIGKVLDRAVSRSLGDEVSLTVILIVALVGGSIAGIIGLYIFSALLRWTGKWLGGTGSSVNLRAAIAWSYAPAAWALLLWLPTLLIIGEDIFKEDLQVIQGNFLAIFWMFVFIVIEIVAAVWAFILLLKCISQVQQFSVWKALGNIILSVLVIALPIIILVVMTYHVMN